MNENQGDRPKIIIDEDWKTQVQSEKEAAARAPQEKPASGASPQPRPGEMPPASLPMLFSTLATQALMSLGQMPHPVSGQAELDLPQAKHFIDMLEVLEDKTAGNRTAEESQMLENLLHELRMAYVAIGRQPPPAAGPPKPDLGQ
jgi:hypothetical protein